MIKKKILIFSNFYPEEGWGGGVIIRSLTKGHPENIQLKWANYGYDPAKNKKGVNGIEVLDFKPVFFRGRGFSDTILNFETAVFIRDFQIFLETNAIDHLWIVMCGNYDHIYKLGKLVRHLKIPYHVSVHDDPILEIKDSKKKNARKFFSEILTRANSVDVISTRMQSSYENDFGIQPIVITRCIPDNFPQNDKITGQINILMGGYGNAQKPWPDPLLQAIAQLNENADCQLHLFDPKLKPYESGIIKVHDLIREEEFNAILETTNLGYACDDLAPENLKFAQLSLPTKIITYIGAGIPFVYHGPKDTTVGDLLAQYEAGIIVETNNPDDIYQAFQMLLSNYGHYHKNCKLAKEKLFSAQVVQDNFFEALLKSD